MIEFELKLQIPPRRATPSAHSSAGRHGLPSQPVPAGRSTSTPHERLLARCGACVAPASEGDGWVQTLKGSAADGLDDEEYNLRLEGAVDATVRRCRPRRHRGVRWETA